jgi:hypothetical protein
MDKENVLNEQLEIKQKISSLNPSIKKPKSKNDVERAMAQMDKINRTGFSKWIKAESNVSYLCSFKGPLILEYVQEDQESAMHALEWLIEGWSVESVAELVLKLFYSCGISSRVFSERLFALIHSWVRVEVAGLIPILLIGESITVCSSFFSHWYIVSGWDVHEMSEIVVPIAEGLNWDAKQLPEFLLGTVYLLVNDSIVRQSMMMVIKDEFVSPMQSSTEFIDRFELLYSIVLNERNRVSDLGGNCKVGMEKEFDDLCLREE